MRNFKDLVVWKKAHALTLSLYVATRTFPKDELYGEVSHRSASVNWDKLSESHRPLEEQRDLNISDLEMDMTMNEVVQRISTDREYARLFHAAYGSEPRPELVPKGIATFMRSLVSGTSRYDRHLRGDTSAPNASIRTYSGVSDLS